MTSKLYEEALADATKLREIAEQNAKNAIIESITPKIRELIDAQILGEDADDETSIIEAAIPESLPEEEVEHELTPEMANELKEMFFADAAEQEVVAEEHEKPTIEESAEKVNACAEYVTLVSSLVDRVKAVDFSMLNEADLQKSIALVAISDKAITKLKEMIESVDDTSLLEGVIQNSNDQIQKLYKEINDMKRSLRDLLSEEVITIELDLGEDAVVDSEEISVKVKEEEDLIDAEASEEEVDVEAEEEVEVSAEEEVDLSEILNELEEEMEEGAYGHSMEEDEGMGEGGMYYEEEDADEAYMYEEDDDAHEGHGHKMMEGLDDDTVLEIDENMLRDELAKLMQESEFDAEEEVLEETAEPVATEQNDELQAEIESYQSAVTDLQSQLAEMSLFNAKLLYTNKLLMNSDLSRTQRAQAIETLDDAASLREVKLLFKTLTESFSKRAEDKTSSRNIGGASRPTKSASMTLNESPEANRWALLAGIK